MANILDTPLAIFGADPKVDKFSGIDELGREVYERNGHKYVIGDVDMPDSIPEQAKDVYEAIPPMEEWTAPSFDEIMGVAEGLVKGVADTAKRVVEAPTNPNATVGDLVDTAGSMATGGIGYTAVKGAPKDSLGMFIGVRDPAKVDEAVSMLERGFDSKDVALRLGLRKSPEGHWVEEISDNNFRVDPNLKFKLRQTPGTITGPSNKIFNHPELYDAYPELATARSSITNDNSKLSPNFSGQFNPADRSLVMRESAPDDVALHELQHAVQKSEGWDGGSNPGWLANQVNMTIENLPKTARNYLDSLDQVAIMERDILGLDELITNLKETGQKDAFGKSLKELETLYEDSSKELANAYEVIDKSKERIGPITDSLDELFTIAKSSWMDGDSAHQMYLNNTGEWMARKTQSRKNLNDFQRSLPENDPFKDVPDDLWTNKQLSDVLRRISDETQRYHGQSTYGDEMMKIPKGYAKGGLIDEGEDMEPTQPPVGALPKEVADDVPINASEGEYVLPADVVRYLGLEYIEKLVEKAKNGLKENAAKGRIGGEKTPPEAPTEPPVPGAPAMAEGGLVQDNYTGVRQYKDASGNTYQIAVVNGQPTQPIPPGAQMVSQADGINTPVGPEPMQTQQAPKQSDSREAQNNQSPLAGSPTDWAAKDFETFAKSQNTVGERVGQNLVGMATGPIGAIAVKARQSYLKNNVPDLMKEMISTGVDPAGNKLSPEQVSRMQELQPQIEANFASAKKNMTNRNVDRAFAGFGALTSPAGPVAGALGAAVSMGTKAIAEKAFDKVAEMTPDKTVAEKNKELADKTAKNTETASEASASKDSTSKDSGNSASSAKDKEEDKKDTKSGYRKGGLVTRKPEKTIKMAKGGLVKRKC